jgi:LPS export ABC transporter permease LptG/LPS export ABC transporter permease LptF
MHIISPLMRTRLDRYVLREISGPLALGFIIYTFILLLQYLFQSAEMIIQRGLPVSTVIRLILHVIPSTCVLTIPMSMLFAILIAVGRLSSDSELIALRSCGISLMTLFRPVLLLSTLLAGLNIYLSMQVMPHSNHALELLKLEIAARSVSQQIQPRVFYEEWPGKVVYVFEIPQGQTRWKGVFFADTVPRGDKHQITIAEWGEPRVDAAGELLVLSLENAVTHTMSLKDPGDYQVIHQEHWNVVLEDQFTSRKRAEISATKSVRARDLSELWEWIKDPYSTDEMRNVAWVQIHKNFSIPTACLVFGLLALPLGFSNRRGSRSSGFVLSLLVIIGYWIVLSNGEEAARYGNMAPWLAMWLPNVIFGGLGLMLLVRRNRDRGLSLGRLGHGFYALLGGLAALGRRRQERQERRRAERPVSQREKRRDRRRESHEESPREGRLVLRLPQFHLRFPNIMDRYVIRTFLGIFLVVVASGLTLFVMADLTDLLDDIVKNQAPREVVFNYFKYQSLQIFYTICPILVLVTMLMTYSLMSRTNEVTAFKALGVSLFRLSVPAVVIAALISLFNFYLQSEVLPASNRRVSELRDEIIGRSTNRHYQRADRQWVFGQDRFIYNYLHFSEEDETLQRLQVFEFNDDHQLVARLFTQSARYDGEHWTIAGGWRRTFEGRRILDFSPFQEAVRSDFPETPDYFTAEVRPPEQMRFDELKTYIGELEQRGERVPDLKVELYNKISFPVVSLIMALVALPFAFRLGRQGALYGIGVAVVLGIIYMALFVFFSTLGKTGAFPPLLAVWSPNLVFGVMSLYLFLGVRT